LNRNFVRHHHSCITLSSTYYYTVAAEPLNVYSYRFEGIHAHAAKSLGIITLVLYARRFGCASFRLPLPCSLPELLSTGITVCKKCFYRCRGICPGWVAASLRDDDLHARLPPQQPRVRLPLHPFRAAENNGPSASRGSTNSIRDIRIGSNNRRIRKQPETRDRPSHVESAGCRVAFNLLAKSVRINSPDQRPRGDLCRDKICV